MLSQTQIELHYPLRAEPQPLDVVCSGQPNPEMRRALYSRSHRTRVSYLPARMSGHHFAKERA